MTIDIILLMEINIIFLKYITFEILPVEPAGYRPDRGMVRWDPVGPDGTRLNRPVTGRIGEAGGARLNRPRLIWFTCGGRSGRTELNILTDLGQTPGTVWQKKVETSRPDSGQAPGTIWRNRCFEPIAFERLVRRCGVNH